MFTKEQAKNIVDAIEQLIIDHKYKDHTSKSQLKKDEDALIELLTEPPKEDTRTFTHG
jgi:hypothetical protein